MNGIHQRSLLPQGYYFLDSSSTDGIVTFGNPLYFYLIKLNQIIIFCNLLSSICLWSMESCLFLDHLLLFKIYSCKPICSTSHTPRTLQSQSPYYKNKIKILLHRHFESREVILAFINFFNEGFCEMGWLVFQNYGPI